MGKNTWEFPVGDNAIDVMKQGGYNYYIENLQKKYLADMKKILEIDLSNDQARKTIRQLEPLAAEKREKMKEEMIGEFIFFFLLFF